MCSVMLALSEAKRHKLRPGMDFKKTQVLKSEQTRAFSSVDADQ
jgi:hypothetical protein